MEPITDGSWVMGAILNVHFAKARVIAAAIGSDLNIGLWLILEFLSLVPGPIVSLTAFYLRKEY